MRTRRAVGALMLLAGTVALALTSCARSAATLQPPAQDETSGAVEPSWPRIEDAGRMVVGTSADYPPFAFFNEAFRIEGLDPALMRAIGDRLGLEIEMRDLAFDGLHEALQVGQIDAAIAAISVTPERAQVVSFTQPYYVGQDAVLVPRDSAVTVTRIEDLASLNVGVQRGSVYESELEKRLVAEGLMLPTQLATYQDLELALADLAAQRLGAVVMDLHPAREFAESGTVRVAVEGLHRQRFAIALRRGDDELLRRLGDTLAELQADGVLSELVATYVGHAGTTVEPLPTDTPAPATVTPMPTPPCVDAMALVEHVTYDDRGMTAPPTVPGGTPFTKTWRVRNAGTCTWSTSYTLSFARGNTPNADMGGLPIPVPSSVVPGATVDLSVNLVAPPIPGVYQGLWQLHDAYGEAFGETLTVGILVPIPAKPTPAPTQTPVPGITFRADRTSIRSGECVAFTWRVDNARMVYLYPRGQGSVGRDVAFEGLRTECPATTTTYVLRAELTSGAVEEREITIVVDHVARLPRIADFHVQPSRIGAGGCVEIHWDVQGDVNSVSITRDGGALWGNAPFRGSTRDCPPGRGQITYGVDAAGPGGTARAQAAVSVQ